MTNGERNDLLLLFYEFQLSKVLFLVANPPTKAENNDNLFLFNSQMSFFAIFASIFCICEFELCTQEEN